MFGRTIHFGNGNDRERISYSAFSMSTVLHNYQRTDEGVPIRMRTPADGWRRLEKYGQSQSLLSHLASDEAVDLGSDHLSYLHSPEGNSQTLRASWWQNTTSPRKQSCQVIEPEFDDVSRSNPECTGKMRNRGACQMTVKGCSLQNPDCLCDNTATENERQRGDGGEHLQR